MATTLCLSLPPALTHRPSACHALHTNAEHVPLISPTTTGSTVSHVQPIAHSMLAHASHAPLPPMPTLSTNLSVSHALPYPIADTAHSLPIPLHLSYAYSAIKIIISTIAYAISYLILPLLRCPLLLRYYPNLHLGFSGLYTMIGLHSWVHVSLLMGLCVSVTLLI